MLILTRDNIQTIFNMQDAILASKEALSLHTQGKSIVPLRTNINMPLVNGQSLFMPAYAESLNIAGIKIASVFPGNAKLNKPTVPAQMVLIDGNIGEVCAILDGTYLTQLRTGALQGAATDVLARKDAKSALLIGTGGQARTQLEALLNVRNLKEVYIYDLQFERAQQFADAMQKEFAHFNTQIIPVKDCDAAVTKADIITTITTAKRPVFDGNLVRQGTHINGIGAYTPEMQELPSAIVERADKIIFDTKEGVLAEAGDILIPLREGVVTHADFDGDLGEVIRGQIAGRESPQEITLFKAVGSAILDLVTAHKIYEKALALNIGQKVVI